MQKPGMEQVFKLRKQIGDEEDSTNGLPLVSLRDQVAANTNITTFRYANLYQLHSS